MKDLGCEADGLHSSQRQPDVGARVSAHSFKRFARKPDTYDVQILSTEDHPRLKQRGQSIIRDGTIRQWDPDDLQSLTPLRFFPPDAIGNKGIALVIDPDVFAVGDVGELFSRDLQGKAIWAVPRPGHNDSRDYIATSVMPLDRAKLPHWQFERDLDDLFAHRFDYVDWIELKCEDRSTIGLLEPEWNDFDRLTSQTKLLHTTKRRTQPWKTGLPVDYTLRERGWIDAFRHLRNRRYESHPDPRQEALFFSLLAELVDGGKVTRAELNAKMQANHVRHDALSLIERYRGDSVLKRAA